MALFETDANLKSAGALVEVALTELGHDPAVARVEEGTLWRVAAAHAPVTIKLTQREDRNVLAVSTTIMTIAGDAPRLYKELLELNATVVAGVAFGLAGGAVVAIAERPTADLDRSEVVDLVQRVTACGDQHGPGLIAKHGGKKP